MPAAIDEIRKLGRRGHTVFASDTISMSPGNHSRYAAGRAVTASPRRHTSRFIEDVASLLRKERIELLLPAFEEVFYIAKHAAALAPHAKLFCAPFETLAMLHDKARFQTFTRSVGLRVPETVVVTSQDELSRGAALFREHLARPIYSRGGVEIFTNTGPLAGVLPLERCDVTRERPWIVQEYIHGVDVCTFSVVHRGHVTGHSTYVHPREIEHAGGIVFESIDAPDCIDVVRRVAEATSYEGQMGFDFRVTERGPVLIECNPRPTAGVHLMSDDMLDEALADERGSKLRIVPAGVKRKYSVALIRDMLLHFREIPEDMRHLFSSAKEVFADPDDVAPAFYQVLSYSHVLDYKLQRGKRGPNDLMAAYFHDVCWNGEPMPPRDEAAVSRRLDA